MPYTGHIENGKVVLDKPADLEEGTRVRVEVLPPCTGGESGSSAEAGENRTLYERLAPFIGAAEGLPDDAAKNVDHYLYGSAERT